MTAGLGARVDSVWDELTGQDQAIATLRSAAEAGADSSAMTHAWLITGPPGSGRSNLAYAFAAALLAADAPDRTAAVHRQVLARSHPDLGVLASDRVIIAIDEVRALVSSSQFSPSTAPYRVMVIEDADRMTERTSNVLLKALEEPPPRTVWILCAPSEADLIPTIRSRVRSVRLRVPSVEAVAALIAHRDGVDPELAVESARHAQSHIGMAQRLATNTSARSRRAETIQLALAVTSTADAVAAASRLLAIAGDDAAALTIERDDAEREAALRSLGVEPGGTVPPALRAQLRAMEDDQKRRATRSLRDGIDRILLDLLSLFRDILVTQLGATVDLVNLAVADELQRAAAQSTAAQTLATLDAITVARNRIESNVSAVLALEAMMIAAIRGSR